MSEEVGPCEADSSVSQEPESPLPPGVLVARVGAGANCSSAGSAIDILFYTSVIAGAIAVALSAAFPPEPRSKADDGGGGDSPKSPSSGEQDGKTRAAG